MFYGVLNSVLQYGVVANPHQQLSLSGCTTEHPGIKGKLRDNHILYIFLFFALQICFLCNAQDVAPEPSGASVTKVSPYYYGPNAFPIPDILDCTFADLSVRAAADVFWGRRGDTTYDAEIKVTVPLWTHRVNLTLWWTLQEWFRNTDLNMEESGVHPDEWEFARNGSCGGDIYVSTDILIFEERKYRPDVTVRAALKTASGGHSYHHRFYDSAGYFFDAAAAKTLNLSDCWSLRLALSAGFLCWQTDNGRQNDAVMYGVKFGVKYRNWSLFETFGGYSGWEAGACVDGHLANDCPMSLKTVLQYSIKRFDIVAQYQYGFHDYPYQQFRIAVAYNIPILKKKQN